MIIPVIKLRTVVRKIAEKDNRIKLVKGKKAGKRPGLVKLCLLAAITICKWPVPAFYRRGYPTL